MSEYTLEELLPLMTERIKKFTSNESTSVSNETARKIMSSILYCLKEETMKEAKNNLVAVADNKLSPKDAYNYGLQLKKQKIADAKELYEKLRKDFTYLNNRCYLETILEGFPVFFERYNLEFDAENHLLTLDYPLYNEIMGESGIDLIYNYIQCLLIEQNLLNKFESSIIHELFTGYDEEYEELIFNASKVVLKSAIGCSLLNHNITKLDIKISDLIQLKDMFHPYSNQQIEQLLLKEVKKVLANLTITDEISLQYFSSHMKNFSNEIITLSKVDQLGQIFLVKKKVQVHQTPRYVEGVPMEDEKLRYLIEEIRECRYLPDKIALLKEQVHSLLDLKELLKEAFFDEEYVAVFQLFSDTEKEILLREIHEKEKYEEEILDWEKIFLDFIS